MTEVKKQYHHYCAMTSIMKNGSVVKLFKHRMYLTELSHHDICSISVNVISGQIQGELKLSLPGLPGKYVAVMLKLALWLGPLIICMKKFRYFFLEDEWLICVLE